VPAASGHRLPDPGYRTTRRKTGSSGVRSAITRSTDATQSCHCAGSPVSTGPCGAGRPARPDRADRGAEPGARGGTSASPASPLIRTRTPSERSPNERVVARSSSRALPRCTSPALRASGPARRSARAAPRRSRPLAGPSWSRPSTLTGTTSRPDASAAETRVVSCPVGAEIRANRSLGEDLAQLGLLLTREVRVDQLGVLACEGISHLVEHGVARRDEERRRTRCHLSRTDAMNSSSIPTSVRNPPSARADAPTAMPSNGTKNRTLGRGDEGLLCSVGTLGRVELPCRESRHQVSRVVVRTGGPGPGRHGAPRSSGSASRLWDESRCPTGESTLVGDALVG
jgi:hypothetical protein